MHRTIILLLLLHALIFSSVMYGQTLYALPSNPDSSLQTILHRMEGTPLSLKSAADDALANAVSVRTAEALYRGAQGSRRHQAGYFDPALFISANHFDAQSPTATFFSGAPVLSTKQDSLSAGIFWNFPTGTSVALSLNTLKLQTNSAFASLNPQYTTFSLLSVRQPLLGGFFATANKNLEKADRDVEAAKARYDQEVLAVSTQVEQSYWDLYAAERDYAVQRLTADRAEAFLKDTETRAKTGLIGPNQVASARTFLAEQNILLLDREEQLDHLSDALASLIGQRPDPGMSRLITTDDPPSDFPLDDVDQLVEQAMQKNLTLQAAKTDIETQRMLLRATMWASLPQVDLVGSLGGSGLTGIPQDVVFNGTTLPPSTRNGSLGDAASSALKREFPAWSVGITVSIPIGLRSGLGEHDRQEAEVVVAEERGIQLSRSLEEQIRASYRELFNSKRRMTAAREGVDAAQEQIRIGQIEFQNGRTTAFELVRLNEDFAVAQQRYSLALVRSAKAAANLRQLTSGAYSGPKP
jgi:outer membrane protein